MKMIVLLMVVAMLFGCSENRDKCFLQGCERVLSTSGTTIGDCWTYGYDAQQVKELVLNYVERTPLKEIGMPFLCYAALKFEPLRYPNDPRDKTAKFLFQWGGAVETMDRSRECAIGPTLCFTCFLLTTNDVIRVLSFDLQRNWYHRSVYGSDFYDYERGVSRLSIWDGHLNDLNRPEEMFTEQYKDAFAVVSDRLFNYDCTPWATDFQYAKEAVDRRRIFRLVWRTKECLLFLPEVLFNDAAGAL